MKCPNCDGTEFKWHAGVRNTSGVVDGRLRMHDVHPIFFLGCEECSETVKVTDGDRIAEFLNTIGFLGSEAHGKISRA